MDEQVGSLFIYFNDDKPKNYDNFNMYSLQGGFLVVVNTNGSVDHFNSNTIVSFVYTPKEDK